MISPCVSRMRAVRPMRPVRRMRPLRILREPCVCTTSITTCIFSLCSLFTTHYIPSYKRGRGRREERSLWYSHRPNLPSLVIVRANCWYPILCLPLLLLFPCALFPSPLSPLPSCSLPLFLSSSLLFFFYV